MNTASAPTPSDRAPPGTPSLPRPAAPAYVTLDAWRGVAALMVVAFHATATYRGQARLDPRSLVGLGVQCLDEFWLGVQIFFVISGYCIAATADSVRRKPNPVRTFAIRRVMRIYPTFIVWALLMALAIGSAEFLTPDADFWHAKARFVPLSEFGWLDWFSNLTLTHTWLPQALDFVSRTASSASALPTHTSYTLTEVSWTLCYEVQFYFACGLLMAVFPRRFFPAAAGLTLLVALLFLFDPRHDTVFPPHNTFFDVRWLQFAMGIGVYWFLNYGSLRSQAAYAAALVTLAVVCWLARDYPSGVKNTNLYLKFLLELSCCASFGALLVALKSCDKTLGKARWMAPLISCGVFSYSLYLVHWPICKLVSTGLWKLGLRSLGSTLAVTTPICTLASLGAALIYFRFVERRFINTHSPSPVLAQAPLPEPVRS